MNRQQLILDYIPLANKLAWQKNRKTPKNITFDDLKSVAYLGLVQAANNFDSSKGSFANYASIKINGCIIDHLRFFYKNDKIIKIQKENSFIDAKIIDTLDFFDFIEYKFNKFIGRIIKMYYIEEKTMKQIGKEQGITESRVSQILNKCHKDLKILLKGKK